MNRQPELEPGDNTAFLSHALRVSDLPKINTNDAEQVRQRISDYFTICAEDDMKPSVVGVALALGIDRKTLWAWEVGQIHKPKEVVDLIKKAKVVLNLQMEEWMQNGKINPVSAIFLLKNHHSYVDVQEHIVTPSAERAENPELLVENSKYLPE